MAQSARTRALWQKSLLCGVDSCVCALRCDVDVDAIYMAFVLRSKQTGASALRHSSSLVVYICSKQCSRVRGSMGVPEGICALPTTESLRSCSLPHI